MTNKSHDNPIRAYAYQLVMMHLDGRSMNDIAKMILESTNPVYLALSVASFLPDENELQLRKAFAELIVS